MKSLVYMGPGKLDLVEEAMPVGDIVVKVLYSGICGTDLKTYLHGHHFFKPPVILGHECIGEIISINSGQSSFKVGDVVSVAPYIECGKCQACNDGVPALCTNKTFLKTGCFCEFIAVDTKHAEKAMFKIDNIDPVFTLVEPLACVLNGLSKIKTTGKDYLIVGGGPMGALFAITMSLLGKKVTIIETGKWRANQLKQITDARVISDPRELSGKFNGVVLAVNLSELISEYMSFVKDGGDLLLFSGYSKDKRAFIDPYHIHYREVSVSGCTGFSSVNFKKALAMIEEHKAGFNKLISHFFSLEQAEEAFMLLEEGNGMKIVVRM